MIEEDNEPNIIKAIEEIDKPEERDRLLCYSQQGNPPPFETSSEQNLQHPAIKRVLNKQIKKE